MNYLHLLSLCLLAPTFLLAADLPIANTTKSRNAYVELMNRQLGKPLSVETKTSLVDKERLRILQEAYYTERSYVKVELNNDPELMLFFGRERSSCVDDQNCFAITVSPHSRTLARRMFEMGHPKSNDMLPYNNIQGIDTPFCLAVMDDNRNTRTYMRNGFSEIAQQAFFYLPTILVLEHTGINEVDIQKIVPIFPSLQALIMNPGVPAASRKKNADSICDTKVEILYGGWKKGLNAENRARVEHYLSLPYQNQTAERSAQDPVFKESVEDLMSNWIR